MSTELPTEIALASDGILYVSTTGRDPEPIAGRKLFVGYALTKAELVSLGATRILAWAVLGRLAIASDGRVYVDANELSETRGRKVFQGFAVTKDERDRLIDSLHHMAPSIVMDSRVAIQRPRVARS
jgi:hypothetical protein